EQLCVDGELRVSRRGPRGSLVFAFGGARAMRMEASQVLDASDAPLAPHPGWRFALPAVGLAIAAILAIYWSTAASMLEIWARSETFAHGYLIAPISAVLIWRKRHLIKLIAPTTDVLGFGLLAGAGFAWLVA